MNQIDSNKYERKFSPYRKEALTEALNSRTFEIEMYWKRATYFWTFIGASFAAYAAIFVSDFSEENMDSKAFLLSLIASIGFIFSLGWHYANKGSKLWQENWENHVEQLEDEIHGPLYKTVLRRPDQRFLSIKGVSEFLVGPQPYSVSKVNQLISTFIIAIWLLILARSLFEKIEYLDGWSFALITFTVLASLALTIFGKSHLDSHKPRAFIRKVSIAKKKTVKNEKKKKLGFSVCVEVIFTALRNTLLAAGVILGAKFIHVNPNVVYDSVIAGQILKWFFALLAVLLNGLNVADLALKFSNYRINTFLYVIGGLVVCMTICLLFVASVTIEI